MKKLKLTLNDLQVSSFAVDPQRAGNTGTVKGRETTEEEGGTGIHTECYTHCATGCEGTCRVSECPTCWVVCLRTGDMETCQYDCYYVAE